MSHIKILFAPESRGRLIAVWLALALLGCNAARVTQSPASTSFPPVQQATPVPADGWQIVTPGIERRVMELPTASLTSSGEMAVVRLDPAWVTFQVHYSPGAPHSLSEWRGLLPAAAVIVNGGFFDDVDFALGLVVSAAQSSGQSFVGYGGMFQVIGDAVRVRSLVHEPYQGEALAHAVQGFPMLVEAGGVLAPHGDGFDQRSRRTWIGQDSAGRILIGVTHNLITLADLQYWLIDSDLNVQIAFGLDGGRSSGMTVTVPGHEIDYAAWDRLPTIIAVYSR